MEEMRQIRERKDVYVIIIQYGDVCINMKLSNPLDDLESVDYEVNNKEVFQKSFLYSQFFSHLYSV